MTIVITGATGHLGRQVVEQLLARGVDPSTVVAGGRNEEALAALAAHGVRTARIDYADPATLDDAFAGAEKVLLISGSEVGKRSVQHKAVIDAARKVDASLVYTSAPKASTSALVLAPEHKATEGLLEGSGLTYTVLRNNWYTENYDDTIRQAASTGSILTSAGHGRVASATRRDYAEAAAVVLLSDEYAGEILELGGDEPWSVDELASVVADVRGDDVAVEQVSTDQHVAALQGFGLDEGTAGFVAAIDANIADGLLAESDGTLSRIIGRPTTPLRQYVAELLG
ncbi:MULTISPECIES: SDR family oxidoreductase [unclassified Arthrobacter]|uniref:SDR family oxidoreductase n=1 Tax=unclassified Arthrobacter TaxID=235627 RepID=UPI0006F7F42C|nr:SDR family oxidoreductase [Arthrobacter sp. Leaf234]KQO02962.1 NAD(P)-dependent oxidoreductase [Arthrobacter sp. Leaf234]